MQRPEKRVGKAKYLVTKSYHHNIVKAIGVYTFDSMVPLATPT